jgi:hypothetical protein
MQNADDLERQLALIRSASLPLHLTRLLVTSRRLEEYASGPARREAFRVGRAILSGLLTAGYSVRSIADVLEVSTGAVRARAQSGPIETTILAALLDVSLDELEERSARNGVEIIDGRLRSEELVRAVEVRAIQQGSSSGGASVQL